MSQQVEKVLKTALNLPHAVKVLREEAARSNVVKEVCMTFAMRDRARRQITIRRLAYTMAEEGYQFTREQLCTALEVFAKAGVGTLLKDKKGRITALVNIRYTLQSIGKSVLGNEEQVRPFKAKERLQKLSSTPIETPKIVKPPKVKKVLTEKEFEAKPSDEKCKISIKATISGQTIEFWTGLLIGKDEIINLITNLDRVYHNQSI